MQKNEDLIVIFMMVTLTLAVWCLRNACVISGLYGQLGFDVSTMDALVGNTPELPK